MGEMPAMPLGGRNFRARPVTMATVSFRLGSEQSDLPVKNPKASLEFNTNRILGVSMTDTKLCH